MPEYPQTERPSSPALSKGELVSVKIKEAELAEVQQHMMLLAEELHLSYELNQFKNPEAYLLSTADEYLFKLSEELDLSILCDRELFTRICYLLSPSNPAREYFSKLFNLDLLSVDVEQARQLQKKIEYESSAVAFFKKLPKIEPQMEDYTGQVEVPVGGAQFVTLKDAKSISTHGLWQCVGVAFKQADKVFLSHIFYFKPRTNEYYDDGEALLDEGLKHFTIDDSLDIFVVGGARGGKMNLISLWTYLNQRDLLTHVRTANTDSKSFKYNTTGICIDLEHDQILTEC